MLPVNSTIDMTRLLMSVAFSNAENKRQLREKELDSEVSRLKIETSAYLEEVRINAQKDVYLSLVELSKHAFDRKMDFFVKAFSDFMSLMNQQQSVLEKELRILRDKRFTVGITDAEKIQIGKSQTDIRNELEKIRGMIAAITCEFNMRVSNLSPEIANKITRF